MQNMKRLRQIIALMLCAIIVMTDSGVLRVMAEESNLAVTNEVEAEQPEVEKLEAVQPESEQPEAVQPEVESEESKKQEQPYVYWNPDGENEIQDGISEQTPFHNMEQAVAKGMELQSSLQMEVTIYVMSPFQVEKNEEIIVDAKGMTLERWNSNQKIDGWMFELTGGEVTLSNAQVISKSESASPIHYIAIKSGTFKIGKDLKTDGMVMLDFITQVDTDCLPQIQILENLTAEATYLIDTSIEAAFAKTKVIEALYTGGEKGESLRKHFKLYEREATKTWRLESDLENEAAIIMNQQIKIEEQAKLEEPAKSEELVTKIMEKSMEKAAGNGLVYWNVNPNKEESPESDRPVTIGGNDGNSGLSDQYPVLTWERAKEILGGEGGTVVVMNPVVIGDDDMSIGGHAVTTLDGENKIILTQWDKYPSELFIIPPEMEFTLKNIRILATDGTAIRIANTYNGSNLSLGKLMLDEGVVISGGFIQAELNPLSPDQIVEPVIELLTTNVSENAYRVYFSGINDNQEFQYMDVIKVPEGEDATNYLSKVVLHSKNQAAGWMLRKDSYEDNDGIVENHIELYRKFIYTGVFLNGQEGNDDWYGGNCNWPVKTFAKAKEILLANWNDIAPANRIIYICDTVDITDNQVWDMMDGGTDLSSQATIKNCPASFGYHQHHEVSPTTLISVKDGGSLTTAGIKIQYDGTVANTMVEVLPGAIYTMNVGTILTGGLTSYYGTGVKVTGMTGKLTFFTMNGGTITRKSQGVSITSKGVFNMSGGTITDNDRINALGPGAGVSIDASSFVMTGGKITNNTARDLYYGYGGGAYVIGATSTFTMSGGEISENKTSGIYNTSSYSVVSKGGGVYVESGEFVLKGTAKINQNEVRGYSGSRGNGVYIGADAKMQMEGGEISSNKYVSQETAYDSSPSYGRGGGGIGSDGILNITGGIIEGNKQVRGGGIFLFGPNSEFTMTGGTICNNTAVSYYGGGIYNYAGVASGKQPLLSGGTIEGNKALYGAGIYSEYPLTITGTLQIASNVASSCGGGIYNNSNLTMKGGVIAGNEAAYGGGIFNCNVAQLTGGVIKENQATKGGGVYNQSTLYQIGAKITKNKAEQGGSLNAVGNTYLMGGTFDAGNTENIDDKYGVYIDIPTQSTAKFYIDPEAISLMDRVYLNTATSKLYLLKNVPLVGNTGKLPVYLNQDQFSVGSVVVTPAKLSAVAVNGITYTYSNLTNAEPYVDYFVNGKIPPKTQLGGFANNIILVGEGVYLDGSKGLDTNTGTSPSDAVKTFAKAKQIMADKIALAKVRGALNTSDSNYDADGFEPYIYICGQVSVAANSQESPWELDYDTDAFNQRNVTNTEGNILNEKITQIKRFASYNGRLVDLGGTGIIAQPFAMGKLIIDGASGEVDGANNMIGEIIKVNIGRELILENTIVRNNFTTGISNSGGVITMKGSDTGDGTDGVFLTGFGQNGVFLSNGGTMTMQDHSEINNPYYINNNSANGIVPGLNNSVGSVQIIDDGSELYMKDNSILQAPDRCAIYLSGRTTVSDTPMLEMKGQSSIINSSRGIFCLGKNNVAVMKDKARLVNNSTAVYISSASYKTHFTTQDDVEIIGNSSGEKQGVGIYLYNNLANLNIDKGDNAVVDLGGNTKIQNAAIGIRFEQRNNNVIVNLNDNAIIESCIYGVTSMSSFSTLNASGAPTTQISLNQNVRIGGSTNATANTYDGITLQNGGYLTVSMHDNAAIMQNGRYGMYTKGYYYNDTILRVIMDGKSSITNNAAGGIFTEEYNLVSYPSVLCNATIIMSNQAKISNNVGQGVILSKGGILTMKDSASIKGNTAAGKGASILAYGKINIDGTVYIDKEIFLENAKMPITLTKAAVNNYLIGCGDNFIGQTIVEPDGMTLQTADTYIGNFQKTDNFPSGKNMVVKTPNIVVEGENDVYMAGPKTGSLPLEPGNDANNGGGPGSPVATFSRALNILRTLKPGADIIICNYPMTITQSQIWGFDADGTVTNGAGEKWTPKVLRYKEYSNAEMIRVSGSGSLTLENMILDGNKEVFPQGVEMSSIYLRDASAVLNINNGAVIQNSRCTRNYPGAIYNSGTVNINGGSIESNEAYATSGYSQGGAIVNNGTLNMNSGSIKNNSTQNYSNSSSYYSFGGAIYSRGKVKITGGSITGNQSIGRNARGSAIYIGQGTVDISGGVSITGNKVEGTGNDYSYAIGTIFIADGTVNIQDVEISNNEVVNGYGGLGSSYYYFPQGGGIAQYGGLLNMAGTTVSDNICKSIGVDETTATQLGGGIIVIAGNFQFISGSITDNHAKKGAGIYYVGGSSEIAGGVIQNNTPVQSNIIEAKGANSGIYVGANNFRLKGGASTIKDYIYLSSVNYPMILSGSIYQRNRLYTLELGSGFSKGSIVVKPDNDVILDTTSYLQYFEMQMPGYVLEKEAPNLILKQCIYIDSATGADNKSGNNPDNALKTMARAQSIGGAGNYIVYVSGPVYVEYAQAWNFPGTAWVSRYTGFNITGFAQSWPAYLGPLVTVRNQGNLTLQSIAMYGRRDIDNIMEADSLLRIEAGARVTLNAGTKLLRNNNGNGKPGAGIYNNGGTLNIYGGIISKTVSTIGDAIYQNGILNLANESSITGEVYLTGTGTNDATSRFIGVNNSYVPAVDTKLNINIENPYEGRNVVVNSNGINTSETQKSYYQLHTSVNAVYSLEKRMGAANILELHQKDVVYINGISGLDSNTGKTPAEAVQNLQRAYEILRAGGKGGVIVVVDKIIIADTITLRNTQMQGVYHGYYINGGTTVDALGAVSLMRYAQPTAWASLPNTDKYAKKSYLGELIEITSSGVMSLDNMSVDGHSKEVVGNLVHASMGVGSEAALINVKGRLNANTGTVFKQNKNMLQDAKGAAIYINGGILDAIDIKIADTEAPNGKGSGIYQDGICYLNRMPDIQGSIHLTGDGTSAGSKYIEITLRGFAPVNDSLVITMDKAFRGRPVVKYPKASGNLGDYEPTMNDIAIYKMERSITDLYSLGSRIGEKNMLELQYRSQVYIDGIDGADTNTGSVPSQSVKTLKKAYERLKALGGGCLYVVNTVTVNVNTTIDEVTYFENQNKVDISSGSVEIRRYVVPDAKKSDASFTIPGTHLGSLFKVASGTTFNLSDIIVDGHKNPIATGNPFEDVSGSTKVKAPLVEVKSGATLNINENCIMKNNDNSFGGTITNGGAVYNQGILNFDGAQIIGNKAAKGDGVYQDGYFTIVYGATSLKQQEIYLTTVNTGTQQQPLWGADHVIHVQEAFSNNIRIDVDADNPVNGRNVVVYDFENTYDTTVDNEYDHYNLGAQITTVNPKLYLVKSATEKDTLELYNYEILDISVPVEMFLVMAGKPFVTIAGNKSARNEELQAPNYKITNGGDYQTKISIIGFGNDNAAELIGWDNMLLVQQLVDLTGSNLNQKLYLGIVASDTASDNGFKNLATTSLASISNTTPLTLGTLQPQSEGRFTFVGSADSTFFEKYKDLTFHSNLEDKKEHIKTNARAKYQMIYRFELVR